MGPAPTRPYGKKPLPSGLTRPWVRQRPPPPIPRGVRRDRHPRIRSDKKGAKLASGFVICVWFKITILTASWTEVRIANRVILIAQSDPHPPVIWGNFLRFGLRDFKHQRFVICDLEHDTIQTKTMQRGPNKLPYLKTKQWFRRHCRGTMQIRPGTIPLVLSVFRIYLSRFLSLIIQFLSQEIFKPAKNGLEYSRKRAHCRMIHWFWPKHCGTQHNPIYRFLWNVCDRLWSLITGGLRLRLVRHKASERPKRAMRSACPDLIFLASSLSSKENHEKTRIFLSSEPLKFPGKKGKRSKKNECLA